jgi:transcriptional regulator with GAF, ATPase, and Fis domain
MRIEALQGVMLALAAARSSADVLRQIVEGIASCRNVVLARIWLVRTAADDRGERRWLELAASAGNAGPTRFDPTRLDGRFARFELGQGKVGRVAMTGVGVHFESLTGHDGWLFDHDWAAAEGVVSFAAQPLVARGETLGVLALFDRQAIPESTVAWLRTFADHAALAITNARAFEEIAALKRRLELENDYLRAEAAAPFHDILGSSPALQQVLRQIERVAPTDAGVLVLGESGVGKELVAHALHARSARRERPLVRVNCGAIPGELFESEFFGHVRGSFTGAIKDRVGRFELADGGTLFLDEVGEIPLVHQAKLLRVLQEGTFERVGDAQTRRTDVRVIAATNRDLAKAVERGRFRADLYYRLGVFPLEVPPLRERREDLPALAQHFVSRAARRLNVRAPRLDPAALDALSSYDWPGNVRELQHVLERAVILGRGKTLELGELLPRAKKSARPAALPTDEPLPTLAELKRRERAVLEAALERAGGKISGPGGAAELLGVKPTTLASKLAASGLRGGGKGRIRRKRAP